MTLQDIYPIFIDGTPHMETTSQRHSESLAHAGRLMDVRIGTGIGGTEPSNTDRARSIVDALRQPLCAILIDCETNLTWLARADANPDALRKIMDRIRECAQWASDIVDRSVHPHTRRQLDFSSVDLRTAISSAVDLVESECRASRIEVSWDVSDDAAEAIGDEPQLSQVIIHLLLNAIEEIDQSDSPTRKIAVRTERRCEELVVLVEDSGRGVALGRDKVIFESFVSTKPNGMGMGLPICRAIADAHGGHLEVGHGAKGAVFSLHLPAPPTSSRTNMRPLASASPTRIRRIER